MFFGHDLKLQTGFTENSEPVLIIIPFCLALMRLKVFRVVNPVSRNFERNFHFRNFRIFHRWSIGGPPVATDGKASMYPNFPPPVATGGPPMATGGLPWVVSTGWHFPFLLEFTIAGCGRGGCYGWNKNHGPAVL